MGTDRATGSLLFISFLDLKMKNQQLMLPELAHTQIQLFIKREDQIHPYISGNKFRKLIYNLLEAKANKYKTLVTFGGAFSNHIEATAVAGKQSGFKTIGVIRGDELGADMEKTLTTNATLQLAHKNGMQFVFVSREEYGKKHKRAFIEKLENSFGAFYLIRKEVQINWQ